MNEPVRIAKNATASDLSECLGWFGEEIQKRATAQAREEVAGALWETFIDRSQSSVTYTDSPDDSIIQALALSKETKGPLQALADRFDNDGVSADFRFGVQFAIAMIRDDEFEL